MSTDTDSADGSSFGNPHADECPICYEVFWNGHGAEAQEVDAAHPLERIRIPDCGHEFCRECLRQHCKHALSKKEVPISCPLKPSETKCKSCLGVMLVRALLLQEDLNAQDREEYISAFLQEITSDNPKPVFRTITRLDTQDSVITSSATTTARTTSSSSSTQTITTPLSNLYGSLGENSGVDSSSIVADDANSDRPPRPTEQEFDWIHFQRLHRLSVNKTLVPCTRCQEPVNTHCKETTKNDDLIESGTYITRRQVTCLGCQHSFCSIHGDAHPTMSCDDYLRNYKPDKDTRKSERAIRRFCKPCSHCQAPIQKSAGCDHIICPSCNDDMCFQCGTHLYLKGDGMVRSCNKCNQSFIDHRYMGRYRILICLALPFCLPFMILHMVLMTAMTLATCGCFCCFGCGIKLKTIEGEGRPKGGGKGKEFDFRPRLAVQSVLGIIFLPFIDLFHQCGLPCCCHDSSDREDLEERHRVDKEEYVDDEEFQLRTLSTIPTHEDSGDDDP